jgi:hypothetical protein
MNIAAAARPAIAIVADRWFVHHAARADLERLDLSARECFFMRIDRLAGIFVSSLNYVIDAKTGNG